jgi:hypothetical protein
MSGAKKSEGEKDVGEGDGRSCREPGRKGKEQKLRQIGELGG